MIGTKLLLYDPENGYHAYITIKEVASQYCRSLMFSEDTMPSNILGEVGTVIGSDKYAG